MDAVEHITFDNIQMCFDCVVYLVLTDKVSNDRAVVGCVQKQPFADVLQNRCS